MQSKGDARELIELQGSRYHDVVRRYDHRAVAHDLRRHLAKWTVEKLLGSAVACGGIMPGRWRVGKPSIHGVSWCDLCVALAGISMSVTFLQKFRSLLRISCAACTLSAMQIFLPSVSPGDTYCRIRSVFVGLGGHRASVLSRDRCFPTCSNRGGCTPTILTVEQRWVRSVSFCMREETVSLHLSVSKMDSTAVLCHRRWRCICEGIPDDSLQTTSYIACYVWYRQLLALRPSVLPEHRRHTCGHICCCRVPLTGHDAFGCHVIRFPSDCHLASVSICLRVITAHARWQSDVILRYSLVALTDIYNRLSSSQGAVGAAPPVSEQC